MSQSGAVLSDEVAVKVLTVEITIVCQGHCGSDRHQINKALYDSAKGKYFCLQCGRDLRINPPWPFCP